MCSSDLSLMAVTPRVHGCSVHKITVQPQSPGGARIFLRIKRGNGTPNVRNHQFGTQGGLAREENKMQTVAFAPDRTVREA